MKYKLSYYNLPVRETDTSIFIWNAKRGSIVELEKEMWALLENGDFQNERISAHSDSLHKQGIIVNSDLNEYDEIIFCAKQRQYAMGQDSFGLVIAPTLSCNYHCPYCFEHLIKGQNDIMSESVIDSIIATLSQKFSSSPHIKKARITWFGGEPLLAYDKVIVPLQKRVMELCKEHGIMFGASIITNGYFLTKEKFGFLFKENSTKFVQITFDGTEEEYYIRKGTTREAYHRVVHNILDLSEYLAENGLDVKVNIRLNVDNKNFDSIKEFVRKLKLDEKYHDNIVFSLARLRSYDFCKDFNSYCNTDEYEKIEAEFNDYVEKAPKIIEPKLTFCGQHCMNVFCVGVHGELYKCEHDFGVEAHAVGHIDTGLSYNQYFNDFMEQPLPAKCETCKILPVCMGGCPHRRLANKQQVECEHSVENLIKSVDKYILKRPAIKSQAKNRKKSE